MAKDEITLDLVSAPDVSTPYLETGKSITLTSGGGHSTQPAEYGAVFRNCAVYEHIVNNTKSRKNFVQNYCNLRENAYNKGSYSKKRK